MDLLLVIFRRMVFILVLLPMTLLTLLTVMATFVSGLPTCKNKKKMLFCIEYR